MKLNVETGKFWSFKDTKNYKRFDVNYDRSKNVVRTFLFEKIYLLEINRFDAKVYVIPIRYMSYDFTQGFYVGLSGDKKITFSDRDITSVM